MRTLIDLAGLVDDAGLEPALAEARVRSLVTERQLQVAMDRGRGHRGITRLRAHLKAERGPALTRSAAERRLVRLIEAAQLPHPVTNVRVGRSAVDSSGPERS